MIRSYVYVQFLILVGAEGSLRKHSLHRVLNDSLRVYSQHLTKRRLLLTTDKACVVPVNLLVELLAGDLHLLGIDDDDIISRIAPLRSESFT